MKKNYSKQEFQAGISNFSKSLNLNMKFFKKRKKIKSMNLNMKFIVFNNPYQLIFPIPVKVTVWVTWFFASWRRNNGWLEKPSFEWVRGWGEVLGKKFWPPEAKPRPSMNFQKSKIGGLLSRNFSIWHMMEKKWSV